MSMTQTEQASVERIREVCAEIKADVLADVQRFEGAAFTGRNVAEMFGGFSAALSALAGMVDTLATIIESAQAGA